MMNAGFISYDLQFKFLAGTSRGQLNEKQTYFIKIVDLETGDTGLGECSPLWGLSIDIEDLYENKLCEVLNALKKVPRSNSIDETYMVAKEIVGLKYPSIRFGVETALLDLVNTNNQTIFSSPLLQGIPLTINGLVWMSDIEEMRKQAHEKIRMGYSCIKIKIGSLDFESELELLASLRKEFPNITIRVDANGGFSPNNANEVLKALARLNIHSIEQPIEAGQEEAMAKLCAESPLPIALDEELIGNDDKADLLKLIKPGFIILKPSLIGGFKETENWIEIAEKQGVGWWITSALESNIGLNAIAQFTSANDNGMVHGLGTGQLYHNNIGSPLTIRKGQLFYDENTTWDLNIFSDIELK